MSDYEDSDFDISTNKDYATVLSRKKQRGIKQRFGYACIICGYPDGDHELVDVAPILARRNLRHIQALRSWSPHLAHFCPDQDENFVCFCANHHWEWMNGRFTIVPSSDVRRQMREQEIKNFELRQRSVNMGCGDPGRSLLMPPELPCDFEYIPVTGIPLFQVHNMTPSLPETFIFSTQETEEHSMGGWEVKKYPLRHWEIPVYAVLLAAYQPLNNPVRFRSAQSDAAVSEVTELVHMYLRPLTPTTPSLPKPLSDQKITQIQADATAVQTINPAGDTMMQARESPDEDTERGRSTATPTGRINDLWRDEDIPDTMSTATADFPGSDDDPAVTPAVLSSRLQWRHPRLGWGLGSMRFATSSDFIIDPDEPQV